MLFPNPHSSRVLVRKTIAAIVGEVGNIFAGEVEAFLAQEVRERRGDDAKVEFAGDKDDTSKVSPKERRMRKIAKRVIGVSVCFPPGNEIDFEENLVTDKINVYSSIDNNRQV